MLKCPACEQTDQKKFKAISLAQHDPGAQKILAFICKQCGTLFCPVNYESTTDWVKMFPEKKSKKDLDK